MPVAEAGNRGRPAEVRKRVERGSSSFFTCKLRTAALVLWASAHVRCRYPATGGAVRACTPPRGQEMMTVPLRHAAVRATADKRSDRRRRNGLLAPLRRAAAPWVRCRPISHHRPVGERGGGAIFA